MDDEFSAPVDCSAGLAMGCDSYCCRQQIAHSTSSLRHRHLHPVSPLELIAKGPEGFCCHLDLQTRRCTIWADRPLACSAHNCNDDPMLQAVLRHGFSSFADAERQLASIPPAEFVEVPLLMQQGDGLPDQETHQSSALERTPK